MNLSQFNLKLHFCTTCTIIAMPLCANYYIIVIGKYAVII